MRTAAWSSLVLALGLSIGGAMVLREDGGAAPAKVALGPDRSTLEPGYRRALADMADHYWNDDPREPHMRPTQGDGGPRNGLVVDSSPVPTMWQMALFASLLYQEWKLTRDPDAASKLKANWAYVKRVSGSNLAGDGKADHSINISDDAALKAIYLAQMHEVTGDPVALSALLEMIPATMARFAQPGAPRRSLGRSPGGRPLFTGPHGMLYASVDDAEALRIYGLITASVEAMMATAALYAADVSGDADYRAYAIAVWQRVHDDLRTVKENEADTATGLYLTEYELDPAKLKGGPPAARYRFWGKPIRGLSAEYGGGTLAMALLSARLYRLTGEAKYLAEARSIIAAFPRPDAFGRLRDGRIVLIDARDPWSDGFLFPAVVAEVLPLPGVDPDGAFRTALQNTARRIVAARTPDGYYGADWAGPELNFTNGTRSWLEEAKRANEGAGGGQATPQQIMTSANAVAVVQAGYAATR